MSKDAKLLEIYQKEKTAFLSGFKKLRRELKSIRRVTAHSLRLEHFSWQVFNTKCEKKLSSLPSTARDKQPHRRLLNRHTPDSLHSKPA